MLRPQLSALVDPETRGDPLSLLVWTMKSTKNVAGALAELGHPVSDRTVARMPRAQGFSLQADTKVSEGRQHEDRDAQFCYLASLVAAFDANTGLHVTVCHLPLAPRSGTRSNTGCSVRSR